MGLRILEFIKYVENVFCIYRNYCLFTRFPRAFIVLRITLELLFIIVHFALRTCNYIYNGHYKSEILYFNLTTFNSIVLIILPCYHTETYQRLSCHLNSGCKFFESDINVRNRLRTKDSVVVGIIFMFTFVEITFFSYSQLMSASLLDLNPFWHYFFIFHLNLCDLRFVFEYLVLYCVLCVMSTQLELVTRSIDKRNHLEYNNGQLISEVEEWSVIYEHIRESSKLFNTVFGFQTTVMLMTASVYYVIFLYTMTSQSVAGRFTLLQVAVYTCTLSLILIILGLLSRSAQVMENNAVLLRRRLCKLLIMSVSNEECYKVTKDLLRMMSTRSIRARAFGSIPIDMTLLPTSISCFTTYTVIALQFNNVV